MRSIRERDILAAIRKYLALSGFYVIRQHQGLGSKPGVPDLTACKDGRFVAIEVKAPRGRLTEAQQAELAAIRKAGGIAIVAYSLDDVVEALNEAGVDTRRHSQPRLFDAKREAASHG